MMLYPIEKIKLNQCAVLACGMMLWFQFYTGYQYTDKPDVTKLTGVRHGIHYWHEQVHTVSKNLAFQYACTHSLQQKSNLLSFVDLHGKAYCCYCASTEISGYAS
jgi:hypothetical protein